MILAFIIVLLYIEISYTNNHSDFLIFNINHKIFFLGNSSGSTPAEGAAPPAPDPDLDSMHMMLDPHLRPISPDLNNEESKRIFEEHKQLAQEYLKVSFMSLNGI